MIDEQRFIKLTGIVIDNFEGGYYHPDMKQHMSPQDREVMGDSGETMFGLDRKHGEQLSKYPEWEQFWSLIDDADAKDKWKHYYIGGNLSEPLKLLCAKLMFKWFTYLADKYLTVVSQARINSDDRLIIHFSYASWNGEGWFQRYAKALNQATGSKEDIFNTAIKIRTQSANSTIRQQGQHMITLFKNLKLL